MSEGLPRFTKKQFIEEIKSDASDYCGIPITVNEKRIEQLLTKARRYFYHEYDGAGQEAWLAISQAVFTQPRFLETRKIRLPDCIRAIFGVKEKGLYYNGPGGSTNADPDFSPRKYRLGAALLGSSNDLVYAVALTYYNDFVDQFNLKSLAYDFSPLTRDLTIIGRNPKTNVILHVSEYIPEQDLYSDELFYNYVLGLALKTIGRPLSVFEFKLIGGTTVNFSSIVDEGNQLIADVKAEMEDQRQTGFLGVIGDQMI